ncbi:MAG TPA: PKD domain-containing protein [Gemmatimonadaceae bacterium]|nr:PKD domain-containing protein [Gemmatimonadaceae bacterium]
MSAVLRSVRTYLSFSVTAGALLAAAACNDSLVAPTNPAIHPAGRARSDVAAGATSASCAAIATAHPGSADGNYAVRNAAGNTFVVYCAGMSGSPVAYLTLPTQGSASNFGSWSVPNSSSPSTITTWYSRVQFDVDQLQIVTDDHTFAHSNNSHVPGPGVDLDWWDFGNAAGCSWGDDGGANVDLNGTPFSINDMIYVDGWFPTGSINGVYYGWGDGTLVTGKSMNLTGGGDCGDAGIRGNHLQVAFSGPDLPSPTAHVGAVSGNEGASVALSASASGSSGVPVWTSWDLGDGTTGTGPIPASHTYADNGNYTITFTATDGATTPTTVTAIATIANVAPTVSTIPGATIMVGETYTASGTFSDPGADTWTATVDYGSGATALALSGRSVALSNTYIRAGTYTVDVTVTDDDNGAGSAIATVQVLSPAQAGVVLQQMVSSLAPGDAQALTQSLTAFAASVARGNTTAAAGQLNAFQNKLGALKNSGRISDASYALLSGYAQRVGAALGT